MLSCEEQDIPTTNKIDQFTHLNCIADKLPAYDSAIGLGLIIGANCPKALEPQEIIPSVDHGPYGSRSLLGWRVVGPLIQSEEHKTTKCFRVGVSIPVIDAVNNQPQSHYFASSSKIEDHEITNKLQKMYVHDFPEEHTEKTAMSNEDLEFISLMKKGISKTEGHFQLPLPINQEIKKNIRAVFRNFLTKAMLSKTTILLQGKPGIFLILACSIR